MAGNKADNLVAVAAFVASWAAFVAFAAIRTVNRLGKADTLVDNTLHVLVSLVVSLAVFVPCVAVVIQTIFLVCSFGKPSPPELN